MNKTKNRFTKLSLLFAILLTCWSCRNSKLPTSKISFNEDWKFSKGEQSGAELPVFDDSRWETVRLPHDWAIAGPFDSIYNARYGGLPIYGTGWYRKTFEVPASARGRVVSVLFDAAMCNARVWLNGQYLGNRPNGYISFGFDLTPYLQFGAKNTIAVQLSPEDLSSRWYPGAGLYSNVWLEYNHPIHLTQWGTSITTPVVNQQRATVHIETEISTPDEATEYQLRYKILDPNGKIVVNTQAANQHVLDVEINQPALWDTEKPNLYSLITTVLANGKTTDEETTRFGIRSLRFTKDSGFFLNGKHLRIQGVCLHHDNGPLGAVVNRRALERKLEIMKSMGVNSVRTSHNMPSPELLDLCDEMGILVDEEAFDVWKEEKVANDYHKHFDEWAERDIKDMVRRDRNHPSVFMWSIGNEIMEQWQHETGWKIAKMLNDFVKEMDTTRPTTAAFNSWPEAYTSKMATQIDIVGMNYKALHYGAEVNQYVPNTPVIGSETSSCTSSRGVYHLPVEKYETHPSLQVSSYDLIGPPWAYPPDIEFDALEKNPEILGEYMWTGFDYLGEPTPYGGRDNNTNGYWNTDWPARSSYFGAVDLCGFPKDRYYLYQSQWTKTPMVHVLPHWNWEGSGHDTIPVYVYTNCEEAELFVNGESCGKKVKGRDLSKLIVKFFQYDKPYFMSKYRLSWEVPFSPGSLKVVGYIDGKKAAEKEIKTSGIPAKVSLLPDRTQIHADGYDLSYITVRIEDADGNLCPLADNLVKFQVEGAGRIAAVGNGNAATTLPFQASERPAFYGLCMLIVQSASQAGTINITATSNGLAQAVATIQVN